MPDKQGVASAASYYDHVFERARDRGVVFWHCAGLFRVPELAAYLHRWHGDALKLVDVQEPGLVDGAGNLDNQTLTRIFHDRPALA